MGGFQSVGLSSIIEFKFCELNLKATIEEQTRTNINLHSKLHEILWLRLKFSKFIKNLQNPKNTILRTWRTFVDEHKTRSWVPSCASWKYSQGSTKLNFGFWFQIYRWYSLLPTVKTTFNHWKMILTCLYTWFHRCTRVNGVQEVDGYMSGRLKLYIRQVRSCQGQILVEYLMLEFPFWSNVMLGIHKSNSTWFKMNQNHSDHSDSILSSNPSKSNSDEFLRFSTKNAYAKWLCGSFPVYKPTYLDMTIKNFKRRVTFISITNRRVSPL